MTRRYFCRFVSLSRREEKINTYLHHPPHHTPPPHYPLTMVSHRTVQLLGALFWICGATSTSVMIVHNLFIYPASAIDAPTQNKHHFWNFIALSCGIVSFAFFYGPVVFIPLARKEILRIASLEHPRCWHFFHKYRLLALVTFVPCAIVVNKFTKQYFVADMIFGALVTPVSLGLWSGGLFIMMRHFLFYPADLTGVVGGLNVDDINDIEKQVKDKEEDKLSQTQHLLLGCNNDLK